MSPLTRRFHIPSALRSSTLRIDSTQAHGLLQQGALLVDVRRQDDPSAGLAGAIRVAPDEVPGRVPEFPREAGGLLVLVTRPELRWLGCAALPEACWAGASPAAVAMEERAPVAAVR